MYHGKMKKDKKRKGSYMGGRQTMKGGGMKTEMFQDYVKRMFGGGKTK